MSDDQPMANETTSKLVPHDRSLGNGSNIAELGGKRMADYELVLAFPDQSPSFAHGFTCGRLWMMMADQPPHEVQQVVVAEAREGIEAMAMAKGWTEQFKYAGDGWLLVTLTPPQR